MKPLDIHQMIPAAEGWVLRVDHADGQETRHHIVGWATYGNEDEQGITPIAVIGPVIVPVNTWADADELIVNWTILAPDDPR